MLVTSGVEPEDHLTLRAPDGTLAVLCFDVATFAGIASGEHEGDELNRAAPRRERAGEGERSAPPRQPTPVSGSLDALPGQVEVPMAVLAVDDAGQRGLYAPDRVVALTWPAGAPVGVGAYPGFDPERWPTPRLGDWPPPGISRLEPARLQGMVGRFSGCWSRLLTAFLGGSDYPHRSDEAAEALALLGQLDPPAMQEVYTGLNPGVLGVAWVRRPPRPSNIAGRTRRQATGDR